jgi:hypothetical protein
MVRAIELLLVGLAALVVLMPRPTLDAESALKASPIELEEVARLEDQRAAKPTDVDAACELADAYLRFDHPEWSLQALEAFGDKKNPRVHLIRAIARADRFDVKVGHEEAKRGLVLCKENPAGCPELVRQKLELIEKPLGALVEAGVDPRKDPLAARTAIGKALHHTKGLPTPAPAPDKK